MHKYPRLIWRNEKLQKRDFSNLVLEFEFLIYYRISEKQIEPSLPPLRSFEPEDDDDDDDEGYYGG